VSEIGLVEYDPDIVLSENIDSLFDDNDIQEAKLDIENGTYIIRFSQTHGKMNKFRRVVYRGIS
jgi:hypothetical protein